MKKAGLFITALSVLTSMATGSAYAKENRQYQAGMVQSQASAAPNTVPLVQAPFRTNLAYSVGVDAYIYGYTLVEMARTMQTYTEKTPLNTFHHDKLLADASFRDFVTPNNDTLYSSAWLDLSKGPQVLRYPKIDRYFTLQMMDAYSNSFHYIGGSNLDDYQGGKVVIVGPEWKGKLPSDVEVIRAPTDMLWLLGRTSVNGEKDLPNVYKIQEEYTLAPLDAKQKPGSIHLPKIQLGDFDDPSKFYPLLAQLMKLNPPPQKDEAFLSKLEFIGLDYQAGTFHANNDPVVMEGLTKAVKDAKEIIKNSMSILQRPNNGNWRVNNERVGIYDTYYLNRAMIAKRGLAANTAKEAVYATTRVDSDGNPLVGQKKYVIHFEKDQIPQTKSFWSLSIYDSDNHFINNPMNRYSIGDRTEGLKYNEDGSLDIYIQSTPPEGKESNWLPSPTSTTAPNFSLVLRIYTPDESLQENTFVVPAVKVVNE
ncbi:DUF1254 domain-containing protein [Brevibacillus brevis]|uniref:DUF1254 domain-containing protein n=1 Tax=Brevibacillus brevis TaxID=1393 RepID=A0A2Z4MIE9_BREBE|nr:DUF1254 domain-containing protein [Brevibacillus brevis]AWX56234.1 DUF1254 domain-containing protein [Brevibacillus brevis]